ncbi:MAG: SLC13 family permease [Pirellulaceae bacterium]|nr:SLC13 family permease [Pirellulaceae bacterium]
MQVLIISGLGIAVVLIGILWIKLHPFFALVLGAMLILLMTPREIFLETELQSKAIKLLSLDSERSTAELDRAIPKGRYRLWHHGSKLPEDAVIEIQMATQKSATAKFATADFAKLTANDRIIAEEQVITAEQSRFGGVVQRLSAGLAGTFQKIGIPIAMAAIIGTCLLESGAAKRLVFSLTGFFGPKRVAPALTASGFLLGVPVYFDTVFYLLLPLAKALGKQQTQNYVMAVMAIIVGATMAHSLVPPTPGPLLVASELGVSIGAMMLGGTIVGGTAALAGFAYGAWCSRWVKLDLATETSANDSVNDDSAKQLTTMPLWLAALPLAAPIGCLGGVEIWKATVAEKTDGPWLQLLSDPGFVLFVTAIIAIAILRRVVSMKDTLPMMTQAIADAGTILMLTCAGGAFGAALKQLQVATAVAELFPSAMTPYGLLFVAFFLTAMIRVAQGSATVAMITTVGIIAPLMQAQSLPFHPVYVALAIGCGSKPLPWMNDSGFWQVSTMTGMTTRQTLQTFSVALTIMGFVGFTLTLLGAWLIPLA